MPKTSRLHVMLGSAEWEGGTGLREHSEPIARGVVGSLLAECLTSQHLMWHRFVVRNSGNLKPVLRIHHRVAPAAEMNNQCGE